jgi:hypothetical protein
MARPGMAPSGGGGAVAHVGGSVADSRQLDDLALSALTQPADVAVGLGERLLRGDM